MNAQHLAYVCVEGTHIGAHEVLHRWPDKQTGRRGHNILFGCPQEQGTLVQQVTVALRGADFDWNRWAGQPQVSPPQRHAKTPSQTTQQSSKDAGTETDHTLERKQSGNAAASAADFAVSMPLDTGKIRGFADDEEQASDGFERGSETKGSVTLHGLRLQVATGELLGICGEVKLSPARKDQKSAKEACAVPLHIAFSTLYLACWVPCRQHECACNLCCLE